LYRSLAEWAWRLALLAAVLWVGWQVVQLREDIADLADPGDQAEEVAAAAPAVPAQLPSRHASTAAGRA
jgi:hypothetical protein